MPEIRDATYGDREDGGPLWADGLTDVRRFNLNKKLRRHGLKIARIQHSRRLNRNLYNLRRIDNNHVWLPYAKP